MPRLRYLLLSTALFAALPIRVVPAYPLDASDATNIRRLEGYRLAQERQGSAGLPAGALLGRGDIRLALQGYAGPDFDTRAPDAELQTALEAMFRGRDPSYGVVVVDIHDPDQIRWASLRADVKQNPGSVGKVLCMIAVFDALARAFPDIEDRERILATTVLRAGDWVLVGEHQVPHWEPDLTRNRFAVIVPDDKFYLSEWLDHAISASANGAGSVIWREAMLIRQFRDDYPTTPEIAEAFFRETPKTELARLARAVIVEPLDAAGIDTTQLVQGSFWTRASKQKVPGSQSYATPREFARLLFRLEQGRLVDPWSSLEMKRYLYMTKRRYRYAYAPELAQSAVFFKSGSLYQCAPEEGFRCAKYMGNVRNMMNSIAIVESPSGADPDYHYLVSLMSNVLRFNSAWDHSRLGAAIHELVLTRRAVKVREQASETELQEVGKSD